MRQTTEDPWADLALPDAVGVVTSRRVNSSSRFDFFWGRHKEGNPLLILKYGGGQVVSPLPQLNGLELRHMAPDSGVRSVLVWKLTRPEHVELFHELCLDVIRASEKCASERAGVETAIGRTWRWHNLLRGGVRGRLTLAQQMGLVSELLVLDSVLRPSVNPTAAVQAWKGPLGEAQDFVHMGTAIEVKANGTSTESGVRISSEYQLDCGKHESLWLIVANLAQCEGGDTVGAFTLDGLVARVLDWVAEDPEPSLWLRSLLVAVGYDAADEYAVPVWKLEKLDIFHCEDDFPRLVPDRLPHGITDVRYTLSLTDCAAFRRDQSVLESLLTGALHG